MSDIILETINLTKAFGKLVAVNNLNLQVLKGDVFGFLGPNGAGKSTTIRMILSLIKPTNGKTQIFGKDLNKFRSGILNKVGSLVEKPDFYGHLSAIDNLRFIGALNGGVSHQQIEKVLEIVNLRDRMNDRVKKYSHGMKQRLGIAQALLNDPELLILDEPTSGLDPNGMREVRELIKKLSKEHNKTIFLSSHLLSEVEQVATRMAIINFGNLIVQGKVDDLLRSGEQYIQIGADNLERAFEIIKKEKFISDILIENGFLKIKTSIDKSSEINELLVKNGIKVSSLIPKRTLEDFYLELTESSYTKYKNGNISRAGDV